MTLWYINTIVIAFLIYFIFLYGLSLYSFYYLAPLSNNIQTVIYSLSFGAYSSIWIFLGFNTKNTEYIGYFLPIILGQALAFILFTRIFTKILVINKKENITSLVDFISKRYGNSHALAITITMFFCILFISYIALQIHALIAIVETTVEHDLHTILTDADYFAVGILVLLAILVITIAARQGTIAEQQLKSIVFISTISIVIKVIALLGMAILAGYLLFKGIAFSRNELFSLDTVKPFLANIHVNWLDFSLRTIFSMLTMICMPHLFYCGALKLQKTQHFYVVRWIFPGYLLLITLIMVPIILVGNMLSNDLVDSHWLIELPFGQNSFLLTLLILVGCFAACIGTIIVCCFMLIRMILGHILFGMPNRLYKVSITRLQVIRWACCIVILVLSYLMYYFASKNIKLLDFGQVIFAGAIQLFPAIIGALYLRLANLRGVIAGLCGGMIVWFFTLLFPLLIQTNPDEAWGVSYLLEIQQRLPIVISYDIFCSAIALGVNFVLFIIVSLVSKKSVTEHWQATRYINQVSSLNMKPILVVKLKDLLALVSRFLGPVQALEHFRNFAERQKVFLDLTHNATEQWISYTEHLLAKKLGSSIARATVKSAIEGKEMPVDDVFILVNEASQAVNFNRILLQEALEYLPQGVIVTNSSLHLVAWNQRCIDLLGLPVNFIQAGKALMEIFYYSAEQGIFTDEKSDCKDSIEIRLKNLQEQMLHHKSYTLEANLPDGTALEISGNPRKNGGFVVVYNDITPFKRNEKSLQEMNESLELRVDERTKELSELNHVLEQANESKTRFLAAVSHDLMQPLNAARLFAATLSQEAIPSSLKSIVTNLEASLQSAEELIDDLLDMSRLENGRISPQIKVVYLKDFFEGLKNEFSASVPKDMIFKVHPCCLAIKTDGKLLRRIIQNFISNAFRYGQGRVVLGARRLENAVRIEVWDQGQGIPKEKQQVIFEEFERLDNEFTKPIKGTGLGLAIADGFCKLLDHPLSVSSWFGKGSVFSVTIPLASKESIKEPLVKDQPVAPQTSVMPLVGEDQSCCILCVDNEEAILLGMETLLSRWGCSVLKAKGLEDCKHLLANGEIPDLAVVDYHLDNGEVGITVISWLKEQLGEMFPCVVVSANNHPSLISLINQEHHLDYLKKPLKPAQLRALLTKYITLN